MQLRRHPRGAEATCSVSGRPSRGARQQAEGLTLDTILAGLDMLVAAKERMRCSSHAPVVLEMALVRLAQLDDLRAAVASSVQWVAKTSSRRRRPATVPGATASARRDPRSPRGGKKKLATEP